MPYRRLPKTDQARLASLRKIIEIENLFDTEHLPVSLRMIQQAKAYLNMFQNFVSQYTESYEIQVSSSKDYQQKMRDARMYVSHFIQVLNFAVMRREIKKEIKTLYGLDPDDFTVPDLSSEEAIASWGAKVIQGEQERVTLHKGVPFSHPTIQLLKVYYDMFLDARFSQKTRQSSTQRAQQNVVKVRGELDELILQIWDAVENYYDNLLPYEKYVACVKCGLIYYYRRGEARLTPKTDEDIRKADAVALKIDFNVAEE